jgi:hypothetical protein
MLASTTLPIRSTASAITNARREKARSGIRGRSARRSIATNDVISTAAAASKMITGGEPQPQTPPWPSARISAVRPAPKVTAPRASTPPPSSARVSRHDRAARTIASRTSGTLTRKTARQSIP